MGFYSVLGGSTAFGTIKLAQRALLEPGASAPELESGSEGLLPEG